MANPHHCVQLDADSGNDHRDVTLADATAPAAERGSSMVRCTTCRKDPAPSPRSLAEAEGAASSLRRLGAEGGGAAARRPPAAAAIAAAPPAQPQEREEKEDRMIHPAQPGWRDAMAMVPAFRAMTGMSVRGARAGLDTDAEYSRAAGWRREEREEGQPDSVPGRSSRASTISREIPRGRTCSTDAGRRPRWRPMAIAGTQRRSGREGMRRADAAGVAPPGTGGTAPSIRRYRP
jgi:hypothetical protein